MNKKIFMLSPKIVPNKTGIIVSMLRRAELLSNAGYEVCLLTMEHDLNTHRFFNEIYESDLLKPRNNLKLVNLFSFLQKKSLEHKKLSFIPYPKAGRDCIFDKNNNRIYKDTDGKYMRYEVFRDNQITHINFFNERVMTHRSRYDDTGRLCTIQKLENKQVISEDYFDINGKLVLKIDYSYTNDVRMVSRIHWFCDEYGYVKKSYRRLVDLFCDVIQDQLCNDPNTLYYFLIDRGVLFSPFWLRPKPKNYFCIGTIHSAHYMTPGDVKSPPNRNYDVYFKNLDKLSALIILTDQQKKDIEDRYGYHKNYVVIPHTLSIEPTVENYEINYEQFISLARYDRVKRLDLLIDIFQKVVSKHSKAKLDLIGFGIEARNLQEKIDKLGLTENIFLKPFISNVNEVLQRTSMMLLTSQSESFCLVVMEALANGCPVISFDIRYGPNEMIKHAQNGYLIEEGDIELYAQTIINYLDNLNIAKDMRKQALRLRKDLSIKKTLQKWAELFDELESNFISNNF